MGIILKSAEELRKIRAAGKAAAEVLDFLTPFVHSGVSTLELDRRASEYMTRHDLIPATLNYNGYPKSICTSINDVVCHGIPSENDVLRSGDIVNVDVTVIKDGYFGDTSRMFLIGEVSPEARLLVERAEKAMYKGIAAIRPYGFLNEIGNAIEGYIEKFDYGIVRDFTGHGVGRKFHEEPAVLHYAVREKGPRLEPGMTFTVEPMINLSSNDEVEVDPDDKWTVRTKDGALSAQWEHTVAVTEKGYEILTLS